MERDIDKCISRLGEEFPSTENQFYAKHIHAHTDARSRTTVRVLIDLWGGIQSLGEFNLCKAPHPMTLVGEGDDTHTHTNITLG